MLIIMIPFKAVLKIKGDDESKAIRKTPHRCSISGNKLQFAWSSLVDSPLSAVDLRD